MSLARPVLRSSNLTLVMQGPCRFPRTRGLPVADAGLRRHAGPRNEAERRARMAEYDLVVRGGTVVTESDAFRADVGIRGERIAAIGENLEGERSLDAGGLLVLPGGVDTHCHIEQLRPEGGTDEETFVSASTSALAGGTTTVIPFSVQ